MSAWGGVILEAGGGFCVLRNCNGRCVDLLEADLENKRVDFFIDGGGLSRMRYCYGSC